jgi:small subunit ribosomal protein S13
VNVEDWDDKQVNAIRTIINEEYKVEGELRSETQINIKRLIDIGSNRGIRPYIN